MTTQPPAAVGFQWKGQQLGVHVIAALQGTLPQGVYKYHCQTKRQVAKVWWAVQPEILVGLLMLNLIALDRPAACGSSINGVKGLKRPKGYSFPCIYCGPAQLLVRSHKCL